MISLRPLFPIIFLLGSLEIGSTPANAAAAAAPASPSILPAPVQKAASSSKEIARETKTEKEEALTIETVNAGRATVAKDRATARTELDRLPAGGNNNEVAAWLSQELTLLDRLDRVYSEQLGTLQHAADLAKEAAEVEERTRSRRPAGATLRPPYGLELLDRLYDERGYLVEAQNWLKTDVNNATEALRDAKDELAEKERARRAAREALDGSAPAQAQGKLRLAELEDHVAQETVRGREHALHTLQLQQSLLGPKLALLRPDLDWLFDHLKFDPEEQLAGVARHEKREAALKKAIVDARSTADKIAALVTAAEKKGDNARELELRRSDRESANESVSLLTAQLERLSAFDAVADQRRRTLGQNAKRSEMVAWHASNRDALAALEKTRKQRVSELAQGRQELQALPDRLTKLGPEETALKIPLTDREQMLRGWLLIAEAERADLDALRTVRLRLEEEVNRRVTIFSLRDSGRKTRDGAVALWNYELFSVQDQPVRVKTLLAVLLLLGVGFTCARWMSAAVSRVVFRRLGVRRGRSAAWQTLLYYGLCLAIVLVAFGLFHVSLTQFSVVSGALAVGLGFGSQAILGNFISGIILLIERPVSAGDVITLDGQEVTVEHIGLRSTVVHSHDNTHIVVPNSQLLDRPVINWTLSDDVVRRRIAVGIAHGSSTREVERVLNEAMRGHASVLTEPAPRVMFLEIGESALKFEAVFWSHLGDTVDVNTEMRHRVVEALGKAGIALAFPRRQLHFETLEPLQIAVVGQVPAESDSVS